MNAISHLLAPRSVAVVGASTDPAKTAGKPVYFLRKHGFKGEIFPVNPRVDAIDGLRCYPGISALPKAPDVGLVLLGAERADAAVRELAELGTKAAIVLASGYAEVGDDGPRRQAELLKAAGSMRLLGPNTIGLVNVTDRIPLSASGALDMDEFAAGPIAFISQSGGILGSMLSRAAGRGIGLSKLISTSNEADLELADFVDHLVDDHRDPCDRALYREHPRCRAVPPRRPEGRSRRQADRRLQNREIGSGRTGGCVAHRRARRQRPDVRRVLPPDRCHSRAELQRPSRHSPGAVQGPQAQGKPRRDPDVDGRGGNVGLRQPGSASDSRRRRPIRKPRRACDPCRRVLKPSSIAIRSM